MGFNGSKFTWTKRRWGKDCIKEWLDRGVCNDEWRILFPHAGIWHLPATHSDHNPILLDTFINMRKKGKPFRFEVAWARDSSCVEIIKKAWQSSWEGNPAINCVGKCKKPGNIYRDGVKDLGKGTLSLPISFYHLSRNVVKNH